MSQEEIEKILITGKSMAREDDIINSVKYVRIDEKRPIIDIGWNVTKNSPIELISTWE